jgi:hypothetical protein
MYHCWQWSGMIEEECTSEAIGCLALEGPTIAAMTTRAEKLSSASSSRSLSSMYQQAHSIMWVPALGCWGANLRAKLDFSSGLNILKGRSHQLFFAPLSRVPSKITPNFRSRAKQNKNYHHTAWGKMGFVMAPWENNTCQKFLQPHQRNTLFCACRNVISVSRTTWRKAGFDDS